MRLRHLTPLLSVLLLALGLAACSPSETASATSANTSAAASGVAALASGTIAPQAYVAQYVDAQVGHVLIDVRTPEEFASGYIEGAVNIPLDQISNRLSEIPQDQQVVLYCRSGNRSNQAASILRSAGYSNILDLGGVIAWQSAGYSLTR